MSDTPFDENRRRLLLSAAALAAIRVVPEASLLAAPPGDPAGARPGEFDFLEGRWKIRHRRLKSPEGSDWDEFPGEATCWTVLVGSGSIEELRIPARGFSGLGIRLIDVERRTWTDFWVNAKSGVLAPPPLTGRFRDGVGTFTAEEEDGGNRVVVRGVWDRITDRSCRWRQGVSKDGGRTWKENWFMDWTRA